MRCSERQPRAQVRWGRTRPLGVGVALVAALLLAGGSARPGYAATQAGAPACPAPTWVGARATAPAGLGSQKIAGQSYRMVVHTHAGGTAARVRVSNAFGTTPNRIDEMYVGLSNPSAGGPAIQAGTNTLVRFGGQRSVTVPAGQRVWSDPVDLDVPADRGVAISFYAVDSGPLSYHSGSTGETDPSYLSTSGNHAGEEAPTAYANSSNPTFTWLGVDGLDVLPATYTPSVVALGDSITDGTYSLPATQTRWPDYLAGRLLARPAGQQLSVLNAGIAGNLVTQDANGIFQQGPAAVRRFSRDVAAQTGVTAVIVLEGINDLGAGRSSAQIIEGYRTLIAAAHAQGLRIYGGTLTPSAGATSASNTDRLALNNWIRTAAEYDGFIDFDAAVRDPVDPTLWRTGYSYDQLHGNSVGYQAMGGAPDLAALVGDGCVVAGAAPAPAVPEAPAVVLLPMTGVALAAWVYARRRRADRSPAAGRSSAPVGALRGPFSA